MGPTVALTVGHLVGRLSTCKKSSFFQQNLMPYYLPRLPLSTTTNGFATTVLQHTISTTPRRWEWKLGQNMESVLPKCSHRLACLLTLITVGRGVLIDVWSHLSKSYDPFTTYRITLQDIRDCAKAQGVEFQYGDILIIRSGWIDTYLKLSQEQREALGKVVNYAHEFVGVEQTEAMVDFLHDNYFSAVAGDQPGFEAWPPGKGLNLHSILLPLVSKVLRLEPTRNLRHVLIIYIYFSGECLSERCGILRSCQRCAESENSTFSSLPVLLPTLLVSVSSTSSLQCSTAYEWIGGVGSMSNAMAIF